MKTTTIVQFTWEELMKFADEVADKAIARYREQIEGEEEINVSQAAKLRRVSEVTIRAWIRDSANPLPARPKNKKAYVIKKRDLENYRIR